VKAVYFTAGDVGHQIIEMVLNSYPEDIAAIVLDKKSSIFDAAENRKIPVQVFSTESKLIDFLPANFDYGFLLWWPKIVSSKLFKLAKYGFINTHPSLLPYGKGKHYNFWALVEQCPFGVTLHQIDEGIDTGPILAQQAIGYDWTDTGGSLYLKAKYAMVDLFQKAYPMIREFSLIPFNQDKNSGSFHLSSELETASQIALEELTTPRALLNKLRARTFPNMPGCWFTENGQRYEISIEIRKVSS
jgi:methionyl-tRNA formyltransferase